MILEILLLLDFYEILLTLNLKILLKEIIAEI